MSDNLPAVPEPPRQEIATLDVDSWVEVAKPIFALASRIYDTDFVPRGLRGSEPATAAAMLYGREIGLPPLTSLGGIHVIDGKPGLSAEQMRAMIFAAGHEIEFTESTGATCTIRGRRRGQERWTPVTWTIDMARSAEIAHKPNWKKFPRAQLQARATTELSRMLFPDVIHGFRSVEELDDMGDGTEAPGEVPASSSKVSRRRTAKRAAAAPAPDVPAPPADASGPPLPGEPGYDDSPPGHADAAPVAAEASGTVPGRGVPETAGEGADTEESPAARDAEARTGEESAPSPVTEAGEPGDDSTPDPGPPPTGEPGEAAPDVATADDRGSSEHEHPTGPRPSSRAQMRMLWGTLGGFGLTTDEEREERLLVATTILGREVDTFGTPEEPALSADEAKTFIDALALVTPAGDRVALNRLLDEYDAARTAQAEQDDADEAAKGES